MESFQADRLYEIAANDLKEIWDSDDFDSPMGEPFSVDGEWTNLLDQQPVILNDPMITDAMQSPRIQTEHSYSLAANDDMVVDIQQDKYKVDYGKDFESECFPAIPMNIASTTSTPEITIKQEPISAPSSPQPEIYSSDQSSPKWSHHSPLANPHSILKQPTIVLATKHGQQQPGSRTASPKVNVKVEPAHTAFHLPPTPPSSTTSDSEGSLSPVYTHQPSSPPGLLQGPPSRKGSGSNGSSSSISRIVIAAATSSSSSLSKGSSSSSSSSSSSLTGSPLISNQPKGATGLLILTEEEKRTLLAEGYPIPLRLPLTKAEEKSLKKIRRKIKNKISAQESRRKKKEYMDALEKKVETLTSENGDYKRRLDSLENNNRSLLSQLQKLQSMYSDVHKVSKTVCTQTGTVMPKRANPKVGKS